ncbi:hypothetical protein D3C81_1692990 [compost metagenome]
MVERTRQAIGNRQAKPQAFGAVPFRVTQLVELTEDFCLVRRSDTDTGIHNLNRHMVTTLAATDQHPTALGVTNGVSNQVT